MFGHPQDQALESVWGRTPNSLLRTKMTRVWQDLHGRQHCTNNCQEPSLRNAKALHQMGIFIWDDWRLVSVGLAEATKNNARFPTPDFSRWFGSTPLGAPHQEGPLMKRWTALVETRVWHHRQ